MGYKIISLPLTRPFFEASDKELENLYNWTLANIEARIHQFGSLVRESPEFRDWMPSKRMGSLGNLDAWLFEEVTKSVVPTEIAENTMYFNSRHKLFLPFTQGIDMGPRLLSISYDIGLYLGEVFLTEHPLLRWTLCRMKDGLVKNADYGQPVIASFGSSGHVNPFRLVSVVVQNKLTGKKDARGVAEMFSYWQQFVADCDDD